LDDGFGRVHSFDEVFFGAELEGFLSMDGMGVVGEGDDGDAVGDLAAVEEFEEAKAGVFREKYVEEDDGGMILSDEGEEVLAVSGDDGSEAVMAKLGGIHLREEEVVFDDEDGVG